jgi:hypothetical protein
VRWASWISRLLCVGWWWTAVLLRWLQSPLVCHWFLPYSVELYGPYPTNVVILGLDIFVVRTVGSGLSVPPDVVYLCLIRMRICLCDALFPVSNFSFCLVFVCMSLIFVLQFVCRIHGLWYPLNFLCCYGVVHHVLIMRVLAVWLLHPGQRKWQLQLPVVTITWEHRSSRSDFCVLGDTSSWCMSFGGWSHSHPAVRLSCSASNLSYTWNRQLVPRMQNKTVYHVSAPVACTGSYE